jgi:Rieske 2Fe-2S family protein
MTDRITPLKPSPRPAPIASNDLDSVRRETIAASTLPSRTYHDPEILAWERETWFANDWICVGREEDVLKKGAYIRAEIAGEPLIVIRGNDKVLRAFYNVCQHRGSMMVTEPCGELVRFQCPYHAWVYDLDGRLHKPRFTDELIDFDYTEHNLVPVRMETWQGFIFLSLNDHAKPLHEALGTLPDFFSRFDFTRLRRAHQIDYDIKANWKIIVENYSECYHCPGVHPVLNKITPYDLGEWLPSSPQWTGAWMEVVGDFETLSLDGLTHGRDLLPGITPVDLKRIYYFIVWPNLLISLHPDYLMIHRINPLETGRTFVSCEFFFDPEEMAKPDFDLSDAIGFWDMTNRQDWEVCELQHAGTRSRSFPKGRYSAFETGPHVFAARVADRYAADGLETEVDPIFKTPEIASRVKSRAAGGS